MKSWVNLLLSCALGALLAALPASRTWAALPLPAIAQAVQLAEQAALALAPAGARILVVPGTLDGRVQLAPCQQVQAFLPAGTPAWGRSRVGLRCTQGPVAWQVYLPVTVQVLAPAVVAAAPLPAGAQLGSTQLTLAEVDWAAGPGTASAHTQSLEERVLARPLAAGQAVRSTDLKARQWFAAGETVHIVAKGSGFAVSAEGQAMNPGLDGQPVRVRTESGRVVVGLPVGQRRVELSL